MKDLYYILGTNAASTPVEIGEAYRSLAKKLGPQAIDNDPFLQSHFREINDAYEILSDPTKRTLYDQAYKKTQRKQLASFKTGNLNIAVTFTFFLFTGLFAYYVTRLINAKKVVKTPEPVAQAALPAPKHHKHKHHVHLATLTRAKTMPVKKDSIVGAAVKPAPAIVAAKPAAPVNSPPLAAVKAPPVVLPDSSYTTSLKSNLAGLVYLHQTDDYMSPVVSVLPHRSKIKVLEKGANFYKVNFNEQVGYIPKWTIARQ